MQIIYECKTNIIYYFINFIFEEVNIIIGVVPILTVILIQYIMSKLAYLQFISFRVIKLIILLEVIIPLPMVIIQLIGLIKQLNGLLIIIHFRESLWFYIIKLLDT